MRLASVWVAFFAFAVVGCGPAPGSAPVRSAASPVPRSGPPVDLIALAPPTAVVMLHAQLDAVRTGNRYEWLTSELASELGLASESATLRGLLDRTSEALGTISASGGRQEGALIFSGQYGEGDVESVLRIARARHGGAGEETVGSDGRRVFRLGDAAVIWFDAGTFAVVSGAQMSAHLSQVALRGPRNFRHELIEFGPRIGLPPGSTQAWAQQDTEVGADMVALVFAGENPQMVRNFVSTVRRHLGL